LEKPDRPSTLFGFSLKTFCGQQRFCVYQAICTLDNEAIARITQSAKKYVGNWQRFARDLERIDL